MFSGKTAIVTGGTRGIGRAVAFELGARGAALLITYRSNEKAAAETARRLEERGVRAEFLKGDVADPEHARAAVACLKEKFDGRVDILVNNAGMTRDKLLFRMDASDFDAVLQANLGGAFHMIRAVAPIMAKQRYGRIVNMSSVVGLRGNPGQANYAAAKAGLLGLTFAAAKELGTRGITVNAVAPGYILTDMTEDFTGDRAAAMTEMIALKRAGTPEEVAKVTAFLASDDASYVTGQVLRTDGGMSI